jgi:hypothetical protein
MPSRRTIEEAKRLLVGSPGKCWYFPAGTGGVDKRTGYSHISVSGNRWQAHRLSYMLHIGPIPNLLTIDHLCHNRDDTCAGGPTCRHRACFNPEHLEAVTRAVNSLRGKGLPAINARKTTCQFGHELTSDSRGRRSCKTCTKDRKRRNGEISAKGRKVDRTISPRGHLYDELNTYIELRNDGSFKSRMCRKCCAERARANRKKKARARLCIVS